MDMLRESRRPSLRVRSDMELVRPRLRLSPSVAQLAEELSSTPPPSSLAPAIALTQRTPPNNSFTLTFTSPPCHSTEPPLIHLLTVPRTHISNVDRHRDSAPVPKISAVWTGQMQIIWSRSRLVGSPLTQFETSKQFDYNEWSV